MNNRVIAVYIRPLKSWSKPFYEVIRTALMAEAEALGVPRLHVERSRGCGVLTQLKGGLAEGRYSALMVLSLDQCYRNRAKREQLVQSSHDMGCTVIALKEGIGFAERVQPALTEFGVVPD